MVCANVRLVAIGIFSILPFSAVAQADSGSEPLVVKEIGVIQISDFTSRFPAAFVKSFDLSPDGKTVAVQFEVWEGESKAGIWIALWPENEDWVALSSDNGRRLPDPVKRLEGPDQGVGTDIRYQHQVRFSPDGRMLLVLTGPRLVALALPSLEVLYAIDSPVPAGGRGKGPYMKQFSIAAKAERLAIRYQSYDSPQWNFEVHILDLMNGKGNLSPTGVTPVFSVGWRCRTMVP